MHHNVIVILGILTCLLGGCDDRHTDRKVTGADIVGTWRMTPQSLALLKRDGFTGASGETYTITFADDGTLKFASVLPDFEGGKFVTTSGTWALRHDVSVDNETRRANCLDVVWNRAEKASFAFESGKLILWTWYGDPDRGEHIDYVRD